MHIENIKHRKMFFAVIVGLILLLLIGATYRFIQSQNVGILSEEYIPTVEQTAEDGGLVSDFPQELILASDARIQKSDSYVGKNTSEEPIKILTAVYATNEEWKDLFAAYREYAISNNYTVAKNTVTGKESRLVFMANGQIYFVTITDKGIDGRQVGLMVNKPL